MNRQHREETSRPPKERHLIQSLPDSRTGRQYQVHAIIRPEGLDDHAWDLSLSRLEELGLFPGQPIEKVGSSGRLGAVIVKVGGTRVAISPELASAIVLRTHRP